MDGLLFLLILFWIFKAIMKASKNQSSKTKPKTTSGTKSRPTPKVYRPVQPTVQEPAYQPQEPFSQPGEQSQGSMAYVSTEGMASQEGEDECDPSLGHGQVPERGSVYADEIGGDTIPAITPQSLLQGVVMSEILQRPVSMRRR